MTNRSLTTC